MQLCNKKNMHQSCSSVEVTASFEQLWLNKQMCLLQLINTAAGGGESGWVKKSPWLCCLQVIWKSHRAVFTVVWILGEAAVQLSELTCYAVFST